MENKEVKKFEYMTSGGVNYLLVEFYDQIYVDTEYYNTLIYVDTECYNTLTIYFDRDVNESYLPQTDYQVQLLCDYIFYCFDDNLLTKYIRTNGVKVDNINFEEFNNWK